jgi:hypothetical protein
MYVCMYVRMYSGSRPWQVLLIQPNICVCMFVCVYVCMYVRTYVQWLSAMASDSNPAKHLCMYVCVCVCMYVCMYVVESDHWSWQVQQIHTCDYVDLPQ